jgi:hypothetical protein
MQKAQELREDGTNNWIFENEQFEKWQTPISQPNSLPKLKKVGQNVLWLHGKGLLC